MGRHKMEQRRIEEPKIYDKYNERYGERVKLMKERMGNHELLKQANLYFMYAILDTQNTTLEEVGKTKLGWKKWQCRYIMVIDDCKMSIVEKILESIGIKITYSISVPEDDAKNNPIQKKELIKNEREIINENDIVIRAENLTIYKEREKEVPMPKCIQKSLDNHDRMYGIAELVKYEINKNPGVKVTTTMERVMDVNDYHTVYGFFKENDFYISKLMKITKKEGGKVVWKITKLENND